MGKTGNSNIEGEEKIMAMCKDVWFMDSGINVDPDLGEIARIERQYWRESLA